MKKSVDGVVRTKDVEIEMVSNCGKALARKILATYL